MVDVEFKIISIGEIKEASMVRAKSAKQNWHFFSQSNVTLDFPLSGIHDGYFLSSMVEWSKAGA